MGQMRKYAQFVIAALVLLAAVRSVFAAPTYTRTGPDKFPGFVPDAATAEALAVVLSKPLLGEKRFEDYRWKAVLEKNGWRVRAILKPERLVPDMSDSPPTFLIRKEDAKVVQYIRHPG